MEQIIRENGPSKSDKFTNDNVNPNINHRIKHGNYKEKERTVKI